MYSVKVEMVLSTQYQGEVLESTIVNEVLRMSVEDKDTPHTPAWRAKYFFISGNEDGNYKLETDPETNDGILSIIKVTHQSLAPVHTWLLTQWPDKMHYYLL